MNIRVDWSISSVSGSQAEVTVKVSLDSYSLHLVEVPGAVTVDLNGSTATMDSPAVDYDGKSALNTPFGSKTFTVNLRRVHQPAAECHMALRRKVQRR